MINISSVYVSFQGEGPFTGIPSLFICFQGCNLACIFCDSDPTIQIKDKFLFNGEAVNFMLDFSDVSGYFSNVVLTGGEPLLQQDQEVFKFILALVNFNHKTIEIETNGTIDPLYVNDYIKYRVSPKLSNSGMAHRINPEALKKFNSMGSVFKFVVDVFAPFPLQEVQTLQEEIQIPDEAIWIMPEGTDSKNIIEGTKMLMNLKHNYNVSTRLQIITEATKNYKEIAK